MRSAETISIRSAIAVIAVVAASSTANPSCEANLAARNMRSGSSAKDRSGGPGVRISLARRSSRPP